MSETVCPNCQQPYSESLLKPNRPFKAARVRLINEHTKENKSAYCDHCGGAQWKNLAATVRRIQEEYPKWLQYRHRFVPVLTLHTPVGWEYDVLGLVTSQSVSGTGVFAEFASSITDFLGMQSGTYNKKLQDAEALCTLQLRTKTLALGGNAILATDIDFAELGGGKGMIMVCMSGTAIRLKNTAVLGPETATILDEMARRHIEVLELAG